MLATKRKSFWLPAVFLVPIYLMSITIGWYTLLEPVIFGPPQKLLSWHIINPEIKSGTPLYIEYKLKTNRVCKITLDRWIQNSVVHVLPLVSGSINHIGIKQQTSIVELPTLHPGLYSFYVKARYNCNPFYTYEDLRGPLEFTVVE